MKDRSAHAALLGYYYQFDKTIYSLLNSPASTSFVIEGVEDLDVYNIDKASVIQFKYLASKNYSLPTLRPAIIFMLENFLKGDKTLEYKLYVHFSDTDNKVFKLELEQLKTLLVFQKNSQEVNYIETNKISDQDLVNFIAKFTIEIGKKFEDQRKITFEKIAEVFNVPSLTEKDFYYAKALKVIFDLATQKEAENRKITRKKFVEILSNSNIILFDKWFYQYKSKKQYIALIKSQVKSCKGLQTQKDKLIFIEESLINLSSRQINVDSFIYNLILTYFQTGKTLKDAKCWTVVIQQDAAKMNELKKKLLKKNIKFNDGREDLEFNSNNFNERPLISTTPSDKIKEISFSVKLISAETYRKNLKKITPADCVFYFGQNDPSDYFKSPESQIFNIKVRELEEISQIIF